MKEILDALKDAASMLEDPEMIVGLYDSTNFVARADKLREELKKLIAQYEESLKPAGL